MNDKLELTDEEIQQVKRMREKKTDQCCHHVTVIKEKDDENTTLGAAIAGGLITAIGFLIF